MPAKQRTPVQAMRNAGADTYITLSKATKDYGLTRVQLGDLRRRGKILAKKVQKRWLVERKSIVDYLYQRGNRTSKIRVPAGHVTVYQAAAEADLPPGTIYQLIYKGALPTFRWKGHLYILCADLTTYIEHKGRSPWPPAGYLTAAQAQREFRQSIPSLRKMALRGRVGFVRKGDRYWAFERNSLVQYLKQRRAGRHISPPLPAGILSLEQVAERTGADRSTVRRWIQIKLLPAQDAPRGRWNIREEDLNRFLEFRQQSPRTLILPEGYVTLTQAARKAHVERKVLVGQIEAGALPALKLSARRTCIRSADLERWLTQGTHPGLLPLHEAARAAGVLAVTISAWIRAGKLPSQTLASGRLVVQEVDLQRFLRQRQEFSEQNLQTTKRKRQTKAIHQAIRAPVPASDALTPAQAVREFGLSLSKIHSLIRNQEIIATMPIHRWQIDRASLVAYLQSKSPAPPKGDEGYLSIPEAADRQDVSGPTVLNWVWKKGLPVRKLRYRGRMRYCVTLTDLDIFLQQRARKSHRRPQHSPFSAEYLTPNQAGTELGITGAAVIQWISKGALRARKQPNGYWRIKRSALMEFIRLRTEAIRPTALIADDDLQFLAVATTALQETRYTVVTAVNATDAMLKAHNSPPTLLIVNPDLEGGAGWEITPQVRNLPFCRGTEVIFVLPAAPNDDQMNRLLKLNGQAALIKPVSAENLRKEIGRIKSAIAPAHADALTRQIRHCSQSPFRPSGGSAAAPLGRSPP